MLVELRLLAGPAQDPQADAVRT